MLRGAQRRARPMEFGSPSDPDEANLGTFLPEASWVSPIEDERVLPDTTDPAELAVARESIRLAFVTALQHLPARQRATLILCEVLRWQASEVAELLDTTVAAVNSALQRARATMSSLPGEQRRLDLPSDSAELLERYVDAFERYDIESFVALLHEDAIQSMPPYAMWLQGARDIGAWMVLPGPIGCRGSKLIPAAANGCPAFAQYRPDAAGGFSPWALQVLEISGGRVGAINSFLDANRIFTAFGLPTRLPA
jgi:RNA polymerase sigma-70 factor (ECF subfamily)